MESANERKKRFMERFQKMEEEEEIIYQAQLRLGKLWDSWVEDVKAEGKNPMTKYLEKVDALDMYYESSD